jgi:hypothetical protein
MADSVTRVWRDGAGLVRTVELTAADGARFSVTRRREGAPWVLSWADPGDAVHDVWAHPERYGMTRWYCPGHGGGVCQYGACDEIRYTRVMPAFGDDVAGSGERERQAAESRARLARYARGDVGYRLLG